MEFLFENKINKNTNSLPWLIFTFNCSYLQISNKRIIFTPQGSDLLVLPDKNSIVRKFLLYKLARIAFITADSNLLLEKALHIISQI